MSKLHELLAAEQTPTGAWNTLFEGTLKKFENSQISADRHEGWRYFLEKSTLKAGTDPTEATELRQAELESRESKATQDIGGTNGGGGMSR